MAKTADTAKMADINDPAPERRETRDNLSPDRRTVAPTPDDVKAQAGSDDESVAETARKAASDKARAAKDAAADAAREQADRVREAGESFDADSFAHAATDRIADNLHEAARSIRTADLSHLADDLATFARRQPLLFFGGAALLGFAAGRMLKASERAEHDFDDIRTFSREASR